MKRAADKSKSRPRRKRAAAGIPVARYLHRSRHARWIAAVAVVVMMSALVAADRAGWLGSDGGDLQRLSGRAFICTRVVDGDTIHIQTVDGEVSVRLWGINTPETAKPRDGRAAEPFADEAAAFTRRLCEGREVVVHLEPHRQRDKYGRVLAYVELPDGSILNERLLAAGLAVFVDRYDHRHFDRYELIAHQARRDGVGLWAGDTPRRGDVPKSQKPPAAAPSDTL